MPSHYLVESELLSPFEVFVNFLWTPITFSMLMPGVHKRKERAQKVVCKSRPDVFKGGAIALEGEIKHGAENKYSINGVDFSVTANTCVVGKLEAGAMARVKVVMIAGRQPVAKSVVIMQKASYH